MSAALGEPAFAVYVLKFVDAVGDLPWTDGALFVVRPGGNSLTPVHVAAGGYIPTSAFVFVDKEGSANTADGFKYLENHAENLVLAGVSTRAVTSGQPLVASPADGFNVVAMVARGGPARGH